MRRVFPAVLSVLAAVVLSGCGIVGTRTVYVTAPPSSVIASGVASASSPTSSAASTGKACVTSEHKGNCGPYTYARITGSSGDNTYVINNMWGAESGTTQTLTAVSPEDWSVVAAIKPPGYTGVQTYPDTQQLYTRQDNTPDPLSGFHSIVSSFTEAMSAKGSTSAEAAYDIWLGQNSATNYGNEVMIWNDQVNRGTCGGGTVKAHARFAGQNWTLCDYGGTELIWSLDGNERSGTVHILAMLTWLEKHGYLPRGSGLNQIDYGFEICSTPGPEKFSVTRYEIRSACNADVSC
jgi:hypothetical protein